MSGINKVILIGNVGNLESKYSSEGKIIFKMSIATSEKYKNKQGELVEDTQWHNIVCYGKLAEICSKYISKGSKVYISGKIKTESYEKNGEKKYFTSIVASEVQFLDSKKDNNQSNSFDEKPKQENNNSVFDQVKKTFDIQSDIPF